MYGSLNDASSLSNAFPDVTKQDTARDVRELRASFKSGLTLDIPQRKKVLLQIQKLLVEGEEVIKQALWKDLHKHKTEAYVYDFALTKVELQEHLDYLEDWAKPQKVGTDVGNLPGASYIHKDPLGVVCVIGTWNYPINLLFTPLISAVAAGNCVVARLPGDDTTRYLNNVLISLFDKYIDKRVVRYVYGGVEETKAMLRERYDLIFATGGCFLGKIVARAAAEHLTPTILELGGKSPAIVDNTADIDLAGRRIAWGAFLNSGQTCVRPDYILVDERVGDKLVESLKKYIHKFYGENPQKSESYGRVINERSFTRIQAVLDSDKASITHGGKTDAKENYVEPTLCNFKTNYEAFASSAVMSSELFGPIVPIYYYPAGRFQWAIEYINNHEKPLSSYLFTTNSKNKATITTQTSSGGLVFNDVIMHLGNSQLPFGGVGNSGHGSYHGKAGFDAFSHTKSVLHKYSFLDTAERYAPYSDRNEKVLRLALHAYSRKQIRTFKFLFYTASIAAIAFGVLKAVKKYNP